MEEDQAQNESTPLLENEGQNSSSDQQPSRSVRVRKWALGSFMALLASFTYTRYNYFIKTFQQQASDVLLVKATSSLVIFGSLVLFQKQDVWPRIERCESVRQYWLQGFLLIFQGLCTGGIMILCYISVSLIPIGDAITVIYGEPLCTMILSYIFLGTRLRLFKMFAASFLIAGILLVVPH